MLASGLESTQHLTYSGDPKLILGRTVTSTGQLWMYRGHHVLDGNEKVGTENIKMTGPRA